MKQYVNNNRNHRGHISPSTFRMASKLKLCLVLFDHNLVVERSVKFLD